MPGITSKAMALNIGVFLLESSVRRNVGSLSLNYPSPTASVTSFATSLAPGETFTWVTQGSVSACTVFTSSQNCDLSLVLADPANSYAVKSSKLHICDSDVRQVVIKNVGSASSEIRIFQS